ncbi:cytochrome c [Shimia sp. R9_1]|uniref:c-type cytochrome n=1 Tax=unclassified Shimia TaxID=2630038 RepID=UPI001ADADA3D|nr:MULTISPECIES: cytochrome c [unclassified Shimia]MBO9399814.1 cytochrome c [Shimia sp. R9_3]MBO9407712.1 cytochrome c [Shimia sp. R9_1]
MSFKQATVAAAATVAVAAIVWQFAFGASDADAAALRLPYDEAARVAQGAELYAENCAVCHGAALQGAPNWRERDVDGLMPAPPHDASGHTWHHPDEVLFRITKLGTEAVVGQGYQSNMPGFADSMADQDILDVLAFIKSTWPDQVIEMHNSMNAQSE